MKKRICLCRSGATIRTNGSGGIMRMSIDLTIYDGPAILIDRESTLNLSPDDAEKLARDILRVIGKIESI